MQLQILVSLVLVALSPAVIAQFFSDSPLEVGYMHQLEGDIDDGGEFSTRSLYLRTGIPFAREPGRFVALTARYQLTSFDFDGNPPGTLAALDPWDDVYALRLGMPVLWSLTEDWSLFVMPNARLSLENGADPGDSFSGGLLAGGVRKWNENLSLGLGFGMRTQIDDSTRWLPMIYIDWRINDALHLTTRPTGGLVSGPGVTLNWTISDAWSAAFGVHYEKLRLRLDDDNVASPGGVGQHRGVPLYASLAFQPTDHLRVALFGGVRFANELRLEDHRGRSLFEEETDPTPFFGVSLSMRF